MQSPLHKAALNGHTGTVTILVRCGANVNMKDKVINDVAMHIHCNNLL